MPFRPKRTSGEGFPEANGAAAEKVIKEDLQNDRAVEENASEEATADSEPAKADGIEVLLREVHVNGGEVKEGTS